jgi:hypothetical protein
MRLKTMLVLASVIAVGLAAYVSVAANGESAKKEAKPELKVSIAVPVWKEHRTWWWSSGHFHVVVTNISDKTIRLWDDYCPNGYGSLSFNMVGSDGKASFVKKKARNARRASLPEYQALEPGDCMVIEVNPEQWDGFPAGPAPGKKVELDLQVVFEVQADQDAKRLGVWTGRIESKGMRHFVICP